MTKSGTSKFDIAVSGASFAGLAAALALSRALGDGVRIALIDRAVGPAAAAADSRAFAIWAASKNMLASLDVWRDIAAEAEALTSIEISDSALDDGVRPSLLTYDGVTETGAPVGYIVPAAVLHAALYQAVQRSPAIAWIAPAEATAIRAGDQYAELTLSDGGSVTSELVIAAEGRSSKLRDSMGIKTVSWGYEQTGIIAIVKFELSHGGGAIQHFLPGGPFAILPMTDNRACITWSSAEAEAKRVLALDDGAFLDELDQRIGGRFGKITVMGPRQSWPLEMKMARALIARRFALIGDAAHGVHPVAGQGVNLALRDVAALVESVTDCARLGLDFGCASALERYQRWRRYDATMSAAAYDGLNTVFSIDNVLLRAGRGAGLGLLNGFSFGKRLILNEAAGLSGELPKLLRGETV